MSLADSPSFSVEEPSPRFPTTARHGHAQKASTEAAQGTDTAATARQQPIARMAYVVNSIKAGFRKLGAGVLVQTADQGQGNGARGRQRTHAYIEPSARREGGKVLGVKRKARSFERENSFEFYLSTLPKVDPVDRTVNWLFSSDHHPRSREREEEPGSLDVNGRMRHQRLDAIKVDATHPPRPFPAH